MRNGINYDAAPGGAAAATDDRNDDIVDLGVAMEDFGENVGAVGMNEEDDEPRDLKGGESFEQNANKMQMQYNIMKNRAIFTSIILACVNMIAYQQMINDLLYDSNDMRRKSIKKEKGITKKSLRVCDIIH
jgi:hypothetical protein